MAAYAFTNEIIAQALIDAIKRGVKVSLVMDKSQTKGPQASLHDALEKAGTTIRLISPPGGIMHDKFIVTDGKNVEWGSYNYTGRAEDANFENATFLSDGSLAQRYHSDFVSIYNQATPEAQGLGRPVRRFFRRLKSPFKPKG
jgi:phosphatidylserine/phosphatidylglycerophosphate/cardiolipin synthase-like enzyme